MKAIKTDKLLVSEPAWKQELKRIKQCPQRQDATLNQLKDLIGVANKLGFYDAADFLKNI